MEIKEFNNLIKKQKMETEIKKLNKDSDCVCQINTPYKDLCVACKLNKNKQ